MEKIIICEESYKKYYLTKMANSHTFSNVKFYSRKAFFEEYCFSYSKETLYYIINKYHIKNDIARMYLDNLYYLEDKEYQNSKLQFLKNLKEELIKQNLLIFNPYFKEYLKNKTIEVRGYLYIERWEEEIFKELNVKYIPEEKHELTNVGYEFKDIASEVNFVAKKIASLLNQHVSLDNIKLLNVPNSYYHILKRIFNFYHIPIHISKEVSLMGLNVTKIFLDNLDLGIEESYQLIKNENEDIVSKIINIYNSYAFIDDIKILKQLLVEDFKNTYIDNYSSKKAIQLINLDDYISEEDYVFLMSFNSDSIPQYYKDEDYIQDRDKEEVLLYKTNEKNHILKNNILSKLASINNLIISYKLRSLDGECYPSSLLNLEIAQEEIENVSYSILNDKIDYAKMLDEEEKYGTVNENINKYKQTFKDFPYKVYDNKYKGITNLELKDYLKKGLTLSYSSLSNYNKCAFRFYLANILKLDLFNETLDTFIGSLYHDVLEKCLNNNLEVEAEVSNFLKKENKELSSKEKFYVNKIIEDLKITLEALINQKEYIGLDKELHEKYLSIDKSKDIPVKFVGIVDKILAKEVEDKTIVSIVDYKTGNVPTSLNYVPYGLNLQLPIYLYLVKKSHLFSNPYFAGFYLEFIFDKKLKKEDKEKTLKLDGYSNQDLNILKEFDKTYMNSKLIKSLKINNDGNFSKTSKILSNEEINKLTMTVEENIDHSIDNILEGNFAINPKKIGYDKDLGCEYCKFQDICYKKEKDYVILEERNDLDFLRGEEDAIMD